jgi:SAM-dependent methyltransferase
VIPPSAPRLFLVGVAALFWELVMIRWTGSCVRIVAYYSNLILISSFLGLGAGALLAGRRAALWKAVPWLLGACVLGAPLLGALLHTNPDTGAEYVWLGGPEGILDPPIVPFLGLGQGVELPYVLVLALAYLMNTALFLAFGQWLGVLFRTLPPLRAYAVEIGGSLLGILLFAAMSALRLPPPAWLAAGFALVVIALPAARARLVAAGVAALTLVAVWGFSGQFVWSPYYKIHTAPLDRVFDVHRGEVLQFNRPFGFTLTVNNDFHQMMLDLRPRDREHEFFAAWRRVYDAPYRRQPGEPDGPILIVGAGTGNDVSAALRNTTAPVDAVEIDPMIGSLGRRAHLERPYQDPRVRQVIDDARSFSARADTAKYARVVFGFLDSHTVLSSFSSIRLDNFVYTLEAMRRVKDLLRPGGRVVLTFSSNTLWMHRRMVALLDSVFDAPTTVEIDRSRYVNGVIYRNHRRGPGEPPAAAPPDSATRVGAAPRGVAVAIPTDDWPFLYMRARELSPHYVVFMALVALSGSLALGLLPRGRRVIRLPYFFLGAAFFLLETGNVVALSLLFGSTWVVNVAVFSAILALVLLGTLAGAALPGLRLAPVFVLLFAGLLVGWLTPPAALLGIASPLLRAALAGLVFLSPVFCASLVFAHLIRAERDLPQAYGSNLLGAVVGGALEYVSLVTGIKALFLIAAAFYALVMLTLPGGRGRAAAR